MQDEKLKHTEAEEKALNRAVEVIEYALNCMLPKFRERQFYLDMYHSYDELLKLKKWWQSKFVHPLSFFTTEMKSSFYYEGVFGQNSKGIWQVHPWADFSIRSAELLTKVLKSQEDNSDFVRTFYTGSKSLSISGDWFLETYWDERASYIQQPAEFRLGLDGSISRQTFQQEQSKIGLISQQRKGQRFTIKSQPDVRTLHVNSVWPDNKSTFFDNGRFVCVRREIPYQKLLAEQYENGKYINVEMLKGTNMPKMPFGFYDANPNSTHVSYQQMQSKSSPIDSENPNVEIVELWDIQTGECESIGNRSVWMGRIRPYSNLLNPFTHIKNFEELGVLFGTPDGKAVANHWKLINKYENLMADNVELHLRGYTKVTKDAGPGVDAQYRDLRPGSIIKMNNLGGAAHDRMDLFSPQVPAARNDLVAQAQQPMGLNEILSGATPSSNVRSQEQQNQLVNLGAKMLSQSIRNISEGLKSVGKKWVMLNYENLDLDSAVPVIGGSGVEIIRLQPGDIPPIANLSVRLSADLESQKAQKLQQMLQAINLAQAGVPGFQTGMAIKDWFRTQGSFDNPDQYFPPPEIEQQMKMMQMSGGQNMPQEPGAAGATRPPAPNQVAQGAANSGNANIPNL